MIEIRCIRQGGVAAFTVVVLAGSGAATGQELFRDEMTSGAGWSVNASSADTAATFGYDYSADFIPEAPNSVGGDTATTGVKLEANIADPGSNEFLSLYPIGQNFTGNHRLRFDVWTNYDADERINGGSNGTTEFIGGGVGYDNAAADIGVGAQGIATNDGGSGSDWRVFDDGAFLAPEDMIAGDRNGFNPYYSDFLPGVSPPAGQSQVAFPAGTAGSPGFQWTTFEFRVIGDEMTFSVEKPGGDRINIAKVDVTGGEADGNVMLFYADFFTSVSPRPDLTFGVIDNVVVDVPEPATASLLGLSALAVLRRRRG